MSKKDNNKSIWYKMSKFLLQFDKRYVIIKAQKMSNIFDIREDYKEGNRNIMCKASEVGKIVVNKCIERKLPINTQKLQKLLVHIQIECIKQSNLPLFLEDIRIWDCGVAIKEVDDDFTLYGVAFTDSYNDTIILLKSEEEYIDTILNRYGNLTAEEINNLPDAQTVISLGKIRNGNSVPHITAEELIKEFAKADE